MMSELNGHIAGETSEVGGAEVWVRWLLMSGLVCFGFTAVASFVIALKLGSMEFQEDGLVFRLVLKGVFFTALFGGCAWLTHRRQGRVEGSDAVVDRAESVHWGLYGIVGLLLLATIFPLLNEYPWTAPDELHHLVVARNISEHSAYASGNPTIGFTYFDHVDSVGPSVLGPIAFAFKVFSPSIPVARMVIGMFFLGLALGIFFLVRDYWGGRAAIVSVGVTTLSFGTIYLARSLYGEVPALMFLVWSMVCWGRSIKAEGGNGLAVVAGVLWGFGILAKSFLFLSAFPIVGVWIYDRLTMKQISLKKVLLPAMGGVGVLGAWYLSMAYFSHLKTEDISMLYLYRHYLMFGVPSTWWGVEWFLGQPVYSVSLLAIGVFCVSQLFGRVTSPALRVLLMTSQLYLFWWIFYTPASIFRYMWYSCAILGIFSGPLLLWVYEGIRERSASGLRRAVYVIAGISVLIPCGYRLVEQLDLIYIQDQAADERNLAAYLNELPEDTRIGSGYWPSGLSMDFMASRHVQGIEDFSQIDDKYDVIIYNVDFNSMDATVLESMHRIGRYAILHLD